MTEVDTTMPESNSLPPATATLQMNTSENVDSSNALTSTTTTPTPATTTTTTIDKELQQLKEQKNQNGDQIKKKLDDEPMEVDGVDTEEDDSQITSSTENGGEGGGVGGGEDSKMSTDDVVKRSSPITSTEHSKQDIEDEEESADAPKLSKTTVANCEDSQPNVRDVDSQNCDSLPEKPKPVGEESRDSTCSSGKRESAPTEDADSTLSSKEREVSANSNTKKAPTRKPSEDGKSNAKATAAEDDELPMDTSTGSIVEQSAAALNNNTKTDQDETDPLQLPKAVTQRENGLSNASKKSATNCIVDLDDDTDEEMEAVPKKSQQPAENGGTGGATESSTAQKNSATVISSDSDGAVVIGSDSENEVSANETKPAVVTMPKLAPQKPTPQVIDDDDDDCVVIEDDTPAPPDSASDLSKRKLNDVASNSDDSQPPNKRQRNNNVPQANNNGSSGQLAIKDARSLLPAQDNVKRVPEATVYPINITSAQGMAPGPPKLVPMSNVPSLPLPGLSALSSNANLLPGLTDDMFVLEAPSFIVPYIYEKPPSDNLKDIVRNIENKYKLTKEDLADADKSDEFDMITEQNKDDKDEKDEKQNKKKKKRRGGNDDDSWSEESDEDEDDDDDDDSESGMRTKVLIKEASDDLSALKVAIKPVAAVVQATAAAASTAAKPGQENYFESPLGKFFMDIGVGLVQEYVQSDLIRLQKRKMRKSLGKNITEFERAITALSGNLEASKKKNSPFKFTMKRCEFCNFKSESALAMANHYETPHMSPFMHYKCNFCTFEIRNATEIVYHMEAVHNIKARLIKPLPYHQCPNCGFEDNGKAKLARHQPVCAKKFRPDLNLAPPNDWEAPAKIPRIKPRHGLVGTATAYQAMAAQAAAQKAALASIQQQQQVAQARSMQAAALAAAQNAAKIRGRPPVMANKGPMPIPGPAMQRSPSQVRNPMATNVVMPNNYQLAAGHLIQSNLQNANVMGKKGLTGQPSISITPLPRQSAAPQASTPSTSKMPPAGMKPGQQNTGGGVNKTQFVICEICDGYIKDLEQLRNHMQWMHKVKIHPKMIYNRPPLNCQKCQFRFFTDQGLERHLLGSHGLVTSSMQEAANKGKDAGRCPVCGRMYQWKLLNHVSRDHHMTLKPAHLSYKCTVCTATFGMYKQFETHVYTAHSTVAKKAMDGKKNNATSGMGGGASGSGMANANSGAHNLGRNSLGMSNDSLLKPLKINDEITIIPQPASKPRITNMESHVID